MGSTACQEVQGFGIIRSNSARSSRVRSAICGGSSPLPPGLHGNLRRNSITAPAGEPSKFTILDRTHSAVTFRGAGAGEFRNEKA
jgi:hypothetical protein